MKTAETQNPVSSAEEASVEQPGFWADERGAMILEYVLLLLGSLLMFSFMIHPIPTATDKLPALQNALMSFCRDAFEAMTQA